MEKNVIEINKVCKKYTMYNSSKDRFKEAMSISKKIYHTEFWALKDVSFNLKKSEILGIMGRNGAGKSTLLKIITGVLTQTSGEISCEGRISSLLELGAGFNLEYTGIENIYFYCTLMGLTKKEVDEKLNDIIEFAEIGDYVYQPVKTYSSGMFARLAFSCAINVEPEILIVDEILSVGDIRFQSKCFKKFKEFKAKGVSIIYVGHDISTMRSFCDRCIWINNGELVAEGDPTIISAKFTEFMYLNDITKFTNYEKFGKQNESQVDDLSNQVTESNVNDIAEIEEKKSQDDCFKTGEALAHWGKKVGIIDSYEVVNNGENLKICTPNDTITLRLHLKYEEDIDFENLSFAYSIKNKEGTDLIVNTTFDSEIYFSKNSVPKMIEFNFKTQLANGDYYIVLAVEDRKEVVTSYYEYIEGATYFKVYSEKGNYGVIQVEANIKVEVE